MILKKNLSMSLTRYAKAIVLQSLSIVWDYYINCRTYLRVNKHAWQNTTFCCSKKSSSNVYQSHINILTFSRQSGYPQMQASIRA